MILSDELTPHNIETVLHHLAIERNGSKADAKGWITIKSPLRDERHPSFGLNLQTGAWHDHGTDESGDIVTLAEKINRTDTTGAIRWIKDQIGLSDSLQPTNTTIAKTIKTQTKFWTPELKKLLMAAQGRMKDEPDHPVLEDVAMRDSLGINTLEAFGCGIINEYKEDWLALPYDTGCQLYRRGSGGKVIRQIKGSSPKESFFGARKVTGNKPFLYVAKSPRETMLLYQKYNDSADVIGLASGEMGNLSTEQAAWLTEQISKSYYRQVLVFLDCDTDTAYQTAKSLASGIKEIASEQDVLLVNIHEYTDGIYKDVTDCVRDNMPENQFRNLLDNAELIPLFKQIKQTKQVSICKSDLKLNDSLIDLLPPLVKNYLNYAAPLSDVPNEFLITPFLANCGALIGNRRFAEVGGMKIYPTIWTVLFAGSSTLRKSTAISLAKKPFKSIEDAFKSEYERKLQLWKDDKQNAENNKQPFDESKPVRRTLYCSDGFSDLTFWESLRDNSSLISTPGEFTALWSELTRPRNSMKDLALSIFDAEESIRRNTKNAGDIELNNPVWCIAGATTLTNFQRTLSSTERASGLLQRILPVCMEERTKSYRALTELKRPDGELHHYISDALLCLKDMNTRPVAISDDANGLFTDWSHELNDRAEKLSYTLTDIGGFVSRLNVYGLKFALLFQQLDDQNEPISQRNMKAAIALCDWLLGHILYMLSNNYIFNRIYADRLKIRSILEKQPGNQMTRTDLMNLGHFDKEQLDKSIASEIESGFVKEIKTDTGGRPLIEYKLNLNA